MRLQLLHLAWPVPVPPKSWSKPPDVKSHLGFIDCTTWPALYIVRRVAACDLCTAFPRSKVMMLSPNNSLQDSSSPASECRSADYHTLYKRSPQPRKPIPRKGHTKSRRGCFNCKRRRIKCNERHPECNHCLKAGLSCEYPTNMIHFSQQLGLISEPQGSVNLRSTPGNFVRGPQASCMRGMCSRR